MSLRCHLDGRSSLSRGDGADESRYEQRPHRISHQRLRDRRGLCEPHCRIDQCGSHFRACGRIESAGPLDRRADLQHGANGGRRARFFTNGKDVQPSTIEIERSKYVMTGGPLQSVDDRSRSAQRSFFARSTCELKPFKRHRECSPCRRRRALFFWRSSFVADREAASRIRSRELAGIAQAVTGGDYAVHPPIDRSDEVGILGRSFAKMITALRDKAEIEELYEQMAAKSQEREVAVSQPQSEAAETRRRHPARHRSARVAGYGWRG